MIELNVERRVVRLLKEYISIPSVSGEEREFAERYASDLERAGLEVEVDELGNVIARRGDPRVCLTSHLDTVPPDGMEDPFEPRVRDGRIYGRGACDAKANLAVYVVVAELWDGPLEIIGVVREETDSAGVKRVLEEGKMVSDNVINGEPTGLRPVIGHKSRAEVRLRIRGKPRHASSDHPDNPIVRFCRVLERLRERARQYEDELGRPTVVPTRVVSESRATNVTPGELEAVLDVRLNTELSLDELREMLEEECERVEVRAGAPPFKLRGDEAVVRALERALDKFGLPTEPVVWPASTDAGYIRHLGGKDVVVFGPGSIKYAHTPKEHVPIPELVTAVHVLREVVNELSQGCA